MPLLDDAGEALVELGANRLGECVVRRIADEVVAEPELLLRRAGSDEVLSDQREDLLSGLLPQPFGEEGLDIVPAELLADDARALEHRSSGRRASHGSARPTMR